MQKILSKGDNYGNTKSRWITTGPEGSGCGNGAGYWIRNCICAHSLGTNTLPTHWFAGTHSYRSRGSDSLHRRRKNVKKKTWLGNCLVTESSLFSSKWRMQRVRWYPDVCHQTRGCKSWRLCLPGCDRVLCWCCTSSRRNDLQDWRMCDEVRAA